MNSLPHHLNVNALWNVNSQTRRIFGWTTILQNWSDTLTAPPVVTTLLENLKAASDPYYNYNYNYPVYHFLSFLNEEDDGIKWMIYEAVALRWMHGSIRTDYLAELADYIDVDSCFPAFVGSPTSNQTVREFLEAQLTPDELDQVSLMPRLVVPQRLTRSPSATSARTAATATAFAAQAPQYPSIQLRFIRKDDAKTKDDVVNITRRESDLFDIHYSDLDAKVKQKTLGLGRTEVLQHLSYSLRLLTLDEDPFESVQLIVPGMPSILVKPQSLSSSTRDLFYDTIERTMNNWPINA